MKNGFYFLGGLLLLAGACTAPDSYRLVGISRRVSADGTQDAFGTGGNTQTREAYR